MNIETTTEPTKEAVALAVTTAEAATNEKAALEAARFAVQAAMMRRSQ